MQCSVRSTEAQNAQEEQEEDLEKQRRREKSDRRAKHGSERKVKSLRSAEDIYLIPCQLRLVRLKELHI